MTSQSQNKNITISQDGTSTFCTETHIRFNEATAKKSAKKSAKKCINDEKVRDNISTKRMSKNKNGSTRYQGNNEHLTSESIEIRELMKPAYKRVCRLMEEQKKEDKLIHAFCGTGKSRLAVKCILYSIEQGNKNNIIVFPSISLVTQFNQDYLVQFSDTIPIMSVCSRDELNNDEILYTTCPNQIECFMSEHQPKIICCTYQSLQNFKDNTQETNIDLVIFDEAHRSCSDKFSNIIYKKYNKQSLRLFMTATPTDKMKKDMERICYIPYYEALEHKYLKEFELRLDIGRKTKNKSKYVSLYESIARAILKTGNNKILTFHSLANKKHENVSTSRSSASSFNNTKLFQQIFNNIVDTEFPEQRGKYTKSSIKTIIANTLNRTDILREFDENSNTIRIISSCQAIGEGVDTREANMCVFADPKNSHRDIIQNIGRILRSTDNNQIATVLIPIVIDYEEYHLAESDEERDQILRDHLCNSDNYNGIMNVVSALRQDNEEYFNKCLKYPHDENYSKKIKKTIGKKPEKIGNSLSDIIPNILDCDGDDDDEKLLNYTNDKKINVQFFSDTSYNTPTYYGDKTDTDRKTMIVSKLSNTDQNNTEAEYTLYSNDKLEENIDEHICVLNCECRKCVIEKEEKTARLLKQKIRFRTQFDPDFKVLWNLKEEDFEHNIANTVVECSVHDRGSDKWFGMLEKVKSFIGENGKLPRPGGKNVSKEEKRLGSWVSTQRGNYSPDKKKRKYIMKNDPVVATAWEEFMEQYPQLFISNTDVWFSILEEVKSFVDENGKLPRSTGKNISKEEKTLGRWIGTQKKTIPPMKRNGSIL